MIRHAPDIILSILIGLLVTTGFIVFVSASFSILYQSESAFFSAFAMQALGGLLGGLALLFVLAATPVKVLKPLSVPLFIASLVATATVFIPYVGVTINGATRWLSLAGISFQPSEFLKIGVVLAVAYVLQKVRPGAVTLRDIVLPSVIVLISGLVLLLQPDTDTFLVIASSVFAILFAAGLPWRVMASGAAIVLLSAVMLVSTRPYLLDRVETFLHPERDPQGSGYQLQQSLIAIGSGGTFGSGFGESIQKYTYLPEPTTDSIFAVYAEEFGFVGSLFLVLLFLAFAVRGYYVAGRAADTYGAFVATGIVTIIIVQAFMNIMAMTGLFPLGGLPLPFMSRGGTALIALLMMCGLLIAVSRSMVRTVHV